ncbi:MAG: type 4a pilus biogenesis protein PilO [Lentimicrobiaceae bacterium]|jgi:Tfp pilus assembly protein PilO|nr:type 4a pilus biogenesis protein PilO [Lentimicrobiaceae bacterium]
MAKSRQEQLLIVLNEFYKRPVARVSLELFLSVLAVIFFAIFAIKPTLSTMVDLVKEIQDKQKLLSQMNDKIASMSTAQQQYTQYSNQFPLLDEALPKEPMLLNALQIIEKVASENALVVQDISVSDLPSETEEVNIGNAERKTLTFNVTVAGDYLSLRQFVETLMTSRRVFLIEQVVFGASNSRDTQYLVAKLRINLPYYANK